MLKLYRLFLVTTAFVMLSAPLELAAQQRFESNKHPTNLSRRIDPFNNSSIIAGYVIDEFGNGVSSVTLHISGSFTDIATTNNFGFYEFLDIPVFSFCTVIPEAKPGIRYTPQLRSFSLVGDTYDISFVQSPNDAYY